MPCRDFRDSAIRFVSSYGSRAALNHSIKEKLDRGPQFPFWILGFSRHVIKALKLQAHFLAVNFKQPSHPTTDGNRPIVTAGCVPGMAQAERNVDEAPFIADFVEDKRFAKQLVDLLLAWVLAKTPRLPKEKTGRESPHLAAKVHPWSRSVLFASQDRIGGGRERQDGANTQMCLPFMRARQ